MADIIFVDTDGRKRHGEEVKCKQCDNKFVRRLAYKGHKPKECCSVKCSGLLRRKRVKVKCFTCGKETEKTPSKLKAPKHGFSFCDRECKELAQSLEGNCEAIRPQHYKNGAYCYRERHREEIEKGCVDCDEKRKYLIVVHHKDGDRKNGKRDNLEAVCYNCHARRHLCEKNGEWIFNSYKLTPREELVKV